MAARLITTTARKKDISALRDFFKNFGKDRLPQDHVEEISGGPTSLFTRLSSRLASCRC